MEIANTVEVTSLAGKEIGVIHSVNFKIGKAVIYFNYNACPHFCTLNISQLKVA